MGDQISSGHSSSATSSRRSRARCPQLHVAGFVHTVAVAVCCLVGPSSASCSASALVRWRGLRYGMCVAMAVATLGCDDHDVINPRVKCCRKGVQIGVHEDLQVDVGLQRRSWTPRTPHTRTLTPWNNPSRRTRRNVRAEGLPGFGTRQRATMGRRRHGHLLRFSVRPARRPRPNGECQRDEDLRHRPGHRLRTCTPGPSSELKQTTDNVSGPHRRVKPRRLCGCLSSRR
jgi:hypothetical protein